MYLFVHSTSDYGWASDFIPANKGRESYHFISVYKINVRCNKNVNISQVFVQIKSFCLNLSEISHTTECIFSFYLHVFTFPSFSLIVGALFYALVQRNWEWTSNLYFMGGTAVVSLLWWSQLESLHSQPIRTLYIQQCLCQTTGLSHNTEPAPPASLLTWRAATQEER